MSDMTVMTFIALPHQDESPISVLTRTATGNGYLCVHALAKGFDLAVDVKKNGWQLKKSAFVEYIKNHSSERNFARFESAFFGFIGDSRQPKIQFGKIVLPYREFSFKLRICPDCARNGYFERSFHLQWIDVCPIHGSKYLDACPQCGKPIVWTQFDHSICKCRFNFCAAHSIPGDVEASRTIFDHMARGDQLFFNRLLKVLKILGNESETDSENIKNVTLATRIASGNANELVNHLSNRKKIFPSLNPLAYCSPWLKSADEWLANIAAGFVNSQNDVYPEDCSAQCACHTIQLTLGQLSLAYKLSPAKMREKIVAEKFTLTKHKTVKYYSCDSLCKSLNQRLNSVKSFNTIIPISQRRDEDYKNYSEASRFLGVNGQELTKAIKLNLISCFRVPPKFRRLIPTVELEQFSKQYVYLDSLASKLRIKPSALTELFDFAGVQPLRLPDCLHGEIYLKSETQDLTDFLLSIRARHEQNVGRNGVRFLAKQLNLRSVVVKQLLQHDMIHVDLKDAKGSRKDISEAQLTSALEWRANYYTLKELARELDINSIVLSRRFLFCNYIPSIRIADAILIHKNDAKKVCDHLYSYFSPAQAAQYLNVSTSRIHCYLATGILKAVPPSECGGIHTITLFRRIDIEDLASMIT